MEVVPLKTSDDRRTQGADVTLRHSSDSLQCMCLDVCDAAQQLACVDRESQSGIVVVCNNPCNTLSVWTVGGADPNINFQEFLKWKCLPPRTTTYTPIRTVWGGRVHSDRSSFGSCPISGSQARGTQVRCGTVHRLTAQDGPLRRRRHLRATRLPGILGPKGKLKCQKEGEEVNFLIGFQSPSVPVD